MDQHKTYNEKQLDYSTNRDLEKQPNHALDPVVKAPTIKASTQEKQTFIDRIQSSNVFNIVFGGSMGILNPNPGLSIIIGTMVSIFVVQHLALKKRLSSDITIKKWLGSIITLHTIVELFVIILALMKVIQTIASNIWQEKKASVFARVSTG